jgi:ribosomal RNA-processing protein 12
MTDMSAADLEQALATVYKEVLICQKDANKKTRDGAVDILKYFIAHLPGETLLRALATALASTAAATSTNANSVLKSSIVTALCLLLLHHRNDATILAAGVQLLPQIGELLVDDCPHQTKAVLSYLRVFVSTQPAEVVTSEAILPGVVAAFTVSLGSHKAKFASRCRAIMRKLVHRAGVDLLRTVVPASDQPLLDYVCKHARRAKRRKEQLKDQLLSSREERMLGSDSETDGSDDDMDEEDGDDGLGSTAMEIARTAVHGSAGSQEDYRLGKRPKAMRVGENRSASTLPTTLDDLLEDQPSARHRQGDGQVKGAGQKRGRDDSSVAPSGKANKKETSKRTDDDRYNVVVGADGRVVVQEVEPEEEEEEAPAETNKRGKRANEDAEGDTNRPAKQEGPQKRRKLNLKEPGEEYRAKNAGGDVWKKGMLAPHAFIPLDPRLLSKKHREQAVDHFGVVVKGGRSKRAGSSKKGKSGSSGAQFVRNKPKQKRHK